jgi:hypothetical protein
MCPRYLAPLSTAEQDRSAPHHTPTMELLTSDWAPHIEKAVRAIAAVVVAVYVAGLITGTFVHWVNDCIAGKQEWAVPTLVISPTPASAIQKPLKAKARGFKS